MKNVYHLDKKEAQLIRNLAIKLYLKYKTVDNPEFCNNFYDYIFNLTKELQVFLAKSSHNNLPFFRIHGLIIYNDLLGKTPTGWNVSRNKEAYICEFMHFIIASHIGTPFNWKTQQGGRIINDILPVKGFENEQLAIASKSHLKWHVEDAFHDMRGDFLSLMSLRNHGSIPTLVSCPEVNRLDIKYKRELFKEQYYIRADDAHDINNNLNKSLKIDRKLNKSFNKALSLRKIPLLFGHIENPYIRLDQDTLEREEFVTTDAKVAYSKLCDLIEVSSSREVCISGDILIINNYLSVHGREPFFPKYDGNDRWFQRLLLKSGWSETAKYRETLESMILIV